MVYKSCSNLLDLASADALKFPHSPGKLPRVMTVPGIVSGYDSDDEVGQERIILAANFLPLLCQRDQETGRWCFMRDEDSLLLQMRDGFPPDAEIVYVGCLKEYINVSEQEDVAWELYQKYRFVPTFLDPNVQKNFYLGFCKQQLWPLFHYLLPVSPNLHIRFNRALFQAYVAANMEFAKKIVSVMRSDDDYVWVHDYHLMLVPTFLRKQMNRVKLGFFLHSPFPSSEIYRTLPVRDEILRGLLNADVVGFHTFDYARHFLSCCSRMFGLDHELKRGYIGLDYYGRKVSIKILPVGIHMGRLESILSLPDTITKIKQIKEKFRGKRLILGVDDMDIFKGISQKLLGLELLLNDHLDLRGEVVLVQIANPPRGNGKDVKKAREEITTIAERINRSYGGPDYLPVILLDKGMHYYEKVAFYAAAECCIVNAVRDGMNLVPYEYTVCRQGIEEINETSVSVHTSTLIVSEFIGCSPSLSGAVRVNPWNVEEVCDALAVAISLPLPEKEFRHEKHYHYVSSHDVAYWVRSFTQDLERACRRHCSHRCCGVGFGLNFRVVALPLNFRRLSLDHIVSSYNRTHRRALFLDYDGTIMPQCSINKAPSTEIISILNSLCTDPANIVFIVSGRGQDSLCEWFSTCESLGIAAEHGYFLRWNKSLEWESDVSLGGFGWKEIVEPVMRSYTEATDGSCIESKKTALVWHHQDADPDFGSWQAKKLLIHLEKVLANEPVVVSRGHHIVEAKPQGITKGFVVQKILSTLVSSGKTLDFVMCIGDDRSDEDMFESINAIMASSQLLPVETEVFACTVGQKPSQAKYYVEETSGVITLLRGLAAAVARKPENTERVSFEKASGYG